MAAMAALHPNLLQNTTPDIGGGHIQIPRIEPIADGIDEHGIEEDVVDEDGFDEFDEDWDVRDQLNTDLSLIKRTGKFFAYFRPKPSAPNPGLEIEGLRRFGMPLQDHDIQAIIAESHRAPYGKGTETIVNEDVRKTWEIDGSRVRLRHPAWPAELDKIVSTACEQLGVAGGTRVVEAQLYKLLVYEEGAMFKPHKDSEKAPRMFGTLVVCLPSLHTGGELIVSFNKERHVLATAPYSEWTSTCMAWYADVIHSVEPVTSGHRVVLTYNLVAKGWHPPPTAQSLQVHIDQVKQTLIRWMEISSPAFLVYNLEHNYTNASIRASDLKGTDVHRVQCLMHLQQELGIRLFLGSLEKSVSGSCEESWGRGGGWGRRRGYGYYDESEDEDDGGIHPIDDEHDSSLSLLSVVDLDGNVVARNIAVDEDEHIVQIGYLEGRDPDDEDYEGHTGNAGAQATHWYRDTALVIVPEDNWIDFCLSSASSNDFRPLLDTELSKIYLNPTDERARAKCEKICTVAVDKSLYRWDLDKFWALFQGCVAVGRKDIAERAIRAQSYTDRRRVLAVFERCRAAGWDDLAGLTIKSCQCVDTDDFAAVATACQSIRRADLLESFVLANRCGNTASFSAVFNCCMDMKRIDLATGAVRKFRESSQNNPHSRYHNMHDPHIQTDFRKVVLPLVVEHSAKFEFQYWYGCLEVVFEGYDSLAHCQFALKQLADGWKHCEKDDVSSMNIWRRGCLTRALQATPALSIQDAAIVQGAIKEQGEYWVTESLLPVALRKNAEGNIAFALSLWRVLSPESASLASPDRALTTLAPTTIQGISLSKPFKDMYALVGSRGLPTLHETTHYTALDLVAFGKCLGVPGVPEELKDSFKDKILREFKGMSSKHSNQAANLLKEIMNQFGPGFSPWFVDLVQAYILRVVGAEPEQPPNWTMPRRLGCGCLECDRLDKFLLDPSQKSGRFPRAQVIRTHLQSRIGRSDDSFQMTTITQGSPHTLVIEKKHADFTRKHTTWMSVANDTKKFIRGLALGSEQALRTVLGPSYENLAHLKIVTLRRSETGVPLARTYEARIVWSYENRPPTLGMSSSSAAVNNGPASVINSQQEAQSSTGAKRKASEGAVENVRPIKRPVEIIDLSDEP